MTLQKRDASWLWPDMLAMGVFVLGMALRVWGAWVGRCLSEPDPGVVALMARHMAELKEFPIFFYGQAYMGSLEPMVSALMVRLLGSTGFAVGMGTVVFAVLALFFLWRWARDAAGPWGGFAAMLAGVLGPLVYFLFQSLPRGGYMVALAVDAWVLWAAARTAARLYEGRRVGGWRYLALGLVAGVGTWSNMIIASALLTAVLLLAHGMRWKIWKHGVGICSGVMGFLVGLSPWLAYNSRHGWVSLEMSQIGGHDPILQSIQNSWNRFLILQDAGQLPPDSPLLVILALAGLGMAAWGAGVVLMQFRRASHQENYSRVAALVFCIIFACVFATSGFTRTRTGRYWIPLVPGLAVLSAVACAAPGGRTRRGLAWGGLVLLTATQGALSLSAFRSAETRSEAGLKVYQELGEALEQIQAKTLMAPLQLFAMNFALDERVAISNGKQMFYEPILRRAEMTDSPAYTADFYGIETLLRQRGAEWDFVDVAGRRIVWNVRVPSVLLREMEGAQIQALCDEVGVDWKAALMDRNADTWWSPGAEQGGVEKASLEWTFVNPQDVYSLQLVFSHGQSDDGFDFPRRIRVEAKVAGEWRTCIADEPIIPLEWSGPRAYYPSGLARLEYRLALEGVEALRMGLLDTQARFRSMGWRLAELFPFVAQEAPLPKADARTLDALCERVTTAYPEPIVFAPRWVSNKLHQRGCVKDRRLAGLSDRVFSSEDGTLRDGTLPMDQSCLFVVELSHSDATRDTLVAQGIRFQETVEGPWVLFAVDSASGQVGGQALPPAMLWTGDSLLSGHTSARAGHALRLLRSADVPEETKKALVQDVLQWRPLALSGLTEEETHRWGGEKAVQARQQVAHIPRQACLTEFANGLRLEGVDLSTETVTAGGELTMSLYWSAGEKRAEGNELVFIHIRNEEGEMVAQQDYRGSPLLWDNEKVRPIAGECVKEVRRIGIPSDTEPGLLTISIGLYQPDNGRRVKVVCTEAPEVRRQAVTWPGAVHVSR